MTEFTLALDDHARPGMWKPYLQHRGNPRVTHLHAHVGVICPDCGTFFLVCPETNPIGADGVTAKAVTCPRCYWRDTAKFLGWTETALGPRRN